MTEPERKDGMSILDAVDEAPKQKGYMGRIVMGLLVVGIGVGSTLLWGTGKSDKALSTAKDNSGTSNLAQRQDSQYADIINFAEKFTIMAFNVSYTDINHQVDKVGSLMSDNMMSYYQEAFLDPKWVAFLSDNKAYVSYQQISRSTVENTDGTHYWVSVIGKNFFNSDARGAGSQIELPFRLIVVIKSDNGRLTVTNFQRQ